MDDPRFVLGIVSGALSLLAYVIYIFASVFGKTRPNRVTWWVLTLVGVLIASSYYAEGARNTFWIALSYTLGPLIIAIVSIWRGEGGSSKFDLFCLGVALASILVWILSGSALLTLLVNMLIDLFGLLPTIKKSFLKPEGENRGAWLLETVASFLAILAVEEWLFSIWIYPLYLVLLNGAITLLLYRKGLFKS